MVGATGIEPVTPSMSTRCSPAELRALKTLNDVLGPYIGSKAGRQAGLPRSGPGESGGQHLVHFANQFAKMDRLRQHLGILRRLGIRVEGDRGKAGDEHDLDVGIELR